MMTLFVLHLLCNHMIALYWERKVQGIKRFMLYETIFLQMGVILCDQPDKSLFELDA